MLVLLCVCMKEFYDKDCDLSLVKSKKVHIDIDKKELNKLVKVDMAVNMGSTEFLNGMLDFVEEELKKDKNVLDKNNTQNW